jgi:hypothetical protein
VGVSVKGQQGAEIGSATGALGGSTSAFAAGDEMAAPDVAIGNKFAPVGPTVGERLGVWEGSDEGLSEGLTERY